MPAQFAPDAFAELYAQTGGVPRKLNTLMSRVLLMGAVEQLSVIDGELVSAVVADMAGQPFEYEVPLSARGEVALSLVEEAEVAEIPAESEAGFASELNVAENDDFAGTQQTVDFTQAMPAAFDNAETDKYADRFAALEAHVADQDVALRRVLAMMIDWMDNEAAAVHGKTSSRAA